MTAIVLRADARQLPLPDASVDLICTSPPYFSLRSYTDGGEHYAGQIGSEATPAEYTAALIACTREWMRVLKPTGNLWINLGDRYAGAPSGPQGKDGQRADRRQAATYTKQAVRNLGTPHKSLLGLPWRYAIRCVDDLGLILRAEVIWSKPNGLPESVTDRVRRSHEQWFHFTKEPRYFSAVDEIRESYDRFRPGGVANGTAKIGAARLSVNVDFGGARPEQNPLGKLPGSVWEIATEPLKVPAELGVDHFAAFPMEWPRRLIKGWSPVGGTVLDPFGGTGTTALVASALGRVGITVDRSADYCRIAEWRTQDPAQRAKALGVDKPPVEMLGQAQLFDLIAA